MTDHGWRRLLLAAAIVTVGAIAIDASLRRPDVLAALLLVFGLALYARRPRAR